MKNKQIIYLLIAFLFSTSLYFFYEKGVETKDVKINQKQDIIQNIKAEAALKIIEERKDVVPLDVRTEGEYETGHLEKSINIDWENQSIFKSEIEKLDKNKTYILYCRSGNRSSKASIFMKNNGFTSIYNILGGVNSGLLPLVK